MQKKKGKFQHSSFLAGAATTAAGRLVAKDGVLQAIWPYSGHYLPTEENFREFISFLEENSVDLADVKVNSAPNNFCLSQNKRSSGMISDETFPMRFCRDVRSMTMNSLHSRRQRRNQRKLRSLLNPHMMRSWTAHKLSCLR